MEKRESSDALKWSFQYCRTSNPWITHWSKSLNPCRPDRAFNPCWESFPEGFTRVSSTCLRSIRYFPLMEFHWSEVPFLFARSLVHLVMILSVTVGFRHSCMLLNCIFRKSRVLANGKDCTVDRSLRLMPELNWCLCCDDGVIWVVKRTYFTDWMKVVLEIRKGFIWPVSAYFL